MRWCDQNTGRSRHRPRFLLDNLLVCGLAAEASCARVSRAARAVRMMRTWRVGCVYRACLRTDAPVCMMVWAWFHMVLQKCFRMEMQTSMGLQQYVAHVVLRF